MQPLQICIGTIIRIGRESWCLPYAVFFFDGFHFHLSYDEYPEAVDGDVGEEEGDGGGEDAGPQEDSQGEGQGAHGFPQDDAPHLRRKVVRGWVPSSIYHYYLHPVERVKQETVEEGEDVGLEEGDGGEVSGDKCNECI